MLRLLSNIHLQPLRHQELRALSPLLAPRRVLEPWVALAPLVYLPHPLHALATRQTFQTARALVMIQSTLPAQLAHLGLRHHHALAPRLTQQTARALATIQTLLLAHLCHLRQHAQETRQSTWLTAPALGMRQSILLHARQTLPV